MWLLQMKSVELKFVDLFHEHWNVCKRFVLIFDFELGKCVLSKFYSAIKVNFQPLTCCSLIWMYVGKLPLSSWLQYAGVYHNLLFVSFGVRYFFVELNGIWKYCHVCGFSTHLGALSSRTVYCFTTPFRSSHLPIIICRMILMIPYYLPY